MGQATIDNKRRSTTVFAITHFHVGTGGGAIFCKIHHSKQILSFQIEEKSSPGSHLGVNMNGAGDHRYYIRRSTTVYAITLCRVRVAIFCKIHHSKQTLPFQMVEKRFPRKSFRSKYEWGRVP